jgi:hypothetical protein
MHVTSDEGKRGVNFKQPVEEISLQRWRDKEFDKVEELNAEQWRISIRNSVFDPNHFDKPETLLALKNIDDVYSYVDAYFNNPAAQRSILDTLLAVYPIDSTTASSLYYKYETGQVNSIIDMLPYCSHCLRVYLTFSVSVFRGLITPRKTDIIDLQYLYYLPFACLFRSNDKFHRMFAPLFLQDDQTFIMGSTLKRDLAKIIALRDDIETSNRDQWVYQNKDYPPDIESSFTSDLWKQHVRRPEKGEYTDVKNMSPELQKALVEHLNKLKASKTDPGKGVPVDDNELDFLTIEQKIGPEDFCPCGSGKLYKDCHLQEILKRKNT